MKIAATATKRLLAVVAALLFVAVGFVLAEQVANADTENCVSHGEYDRTERFMSVGEVAHLYDVPGWYIDTLEGQNEFKRGYRNCWSDGQTKVVVFYDLDNGLSTRWDIRAN